MNIIGTYRDLKNFRIFKKEMRAEKRNPVSPFNKFGLQINNWGNLVYYQLNCDNRDLMNADYDSEIMVQNKIKPVVEYLSRDMNWGDYLTPQISNFEDENGEPSLSYAIIFVFTGDYFSLTKLMVWRILKLMIIIAAIVCAIIFI